MKTIVVIFIFMLSYSIRGNAQPDLYDLNFEDTSQIWRVQIDTNSCWQIGRPQKPTFSSAYSAPNVAVTDTVNPPPVNDTSFLRIIHVASLGLEVGHTVIIAGKYFVDSDTLSDYGTIEFSPDNGTTWIDLINDTNYSSYIYIWGQPPVLTGRSNGWNDFWILLSELGPLFNVQPGDTVLYRFSFISDSVQTNRDGLMYDDLHFEDWAEGVAEGRSSSLISVFPDPAEDLVSISYATNGRGVITIYNASGGLVKQTEHDFSSGSFLFRREQLPAGIYFVEIRDEEKIYRGKIILK
jgi:hypothetical protein